MVPFDVSARPCRILSFAAVLFFVSFVGSIAFGQADTTPRITLLDGATHPAAGLKIAAGKLTATDLPAGLTLDDLRLIVTPADKTLPLPNEAPYIVELVGGGMIKAKQVKLADDQCTIEWEVGAPLKVPIDVLRAIRFQPSVTSDEFNKAFAAPAADLDRVFVKIDGKIDAVTGLVTALTESTLSVELEGQVRNLPRDRVFGVVVALAAPETRLPRCTFELTDGSVLGGDLVALSDGKSQVQITPASKTEIPWDAVRRVVVRSTRILYLSDLKPVSVKQQAFVTLPRPWQRDRSVTGKPLTFGGRTFEKGIGVQSQNELTFDVPGDFDVLGATIGIDADALGKGDCQFEIHVDGTRVFSERIRGGEEPKDINIPLNRAKQVTLVVLPGAELDLADHADWADVRFLKNKK
jgi:hypothetical protein